MDRQESYSSQAPHQTEGGNSTRSAKSNRSFRKTTALTDKQKRDIIKLYKAKAGSLREIAEIYGIHPTSIYKILKQYNAKVNDESISAKTTVSMKKFHERRRNELAQASAPQVVEEFQQIEYVPPVLFNGDWRQLARDIESEYPRAVLANNLLSQSDLLVYDGSHFIVSVPVKTLTDGVVVGNARRTLSRYFKTDVQLTVRFIPPVEEAQPRTETKQSVWDRFKAFFRN